MVVPGSGWLEDNYEMVWLFQSRPDREMAWLRLAQVHLAVDRLRRLLRFAEREAVADKPRLRCWWRWKL